VHGSSREIDDRVKDVLRQAVSVYRVHTEILDSLRPTHIITQTQCEVCAVSLKDVEAAVCDLVSSRPQIVSLEPMCLADVWTDIERVAIALDAQKRGATLVAALQGRLESLRSATRDLPTRPTIACIEWIEPLMCAGNWVPELVEIAGGRDVLGTAGAHSPYMSWDDLLAADPDVIAVMPCGFDMERARSEMPALTADPRWRSLRAVQNGCVFITDGNQYFNRPGPRLAESAEILAELLHPEQFDFGFQNRGWMHYAG
jgi:iron complex transport system substrate-binding protein